MPIKRGPDGRFAPNGGRPRNKKSKVIVAQAQLVNPAPVNNPIIQAALSGITPTNPGKKQITNILFLVDASTSMQSYWNDTKNYLRNSLEAFKHEALSKNVETRFTVRTFNDYLSSPLVQDRDASTLDTNFTNHIYCGGNTRLWHSVTDSVNDMKRIATQRDSYAENVYLVVIVTDGENNVPRGAVFAEKTLARDPFWTFTAACPPGKKHEFVHAGFDVENVREWESSSRGVRELERDSIVASQGYMAARSLGVTKSMSFYADASKVTSKDLNQLAIIQPVKVTEVKGENPRTGKPWEVRDYVEDYTGKPYQLGSAYYRLDKPEKVQAGKDMLLMDKITKTVYGDSTKQSVRGILNLDSNGQIKLNPGNHANFDIFIKSHSTNRYLPRGTKVAITGV